MDEIARRDRLGVHVVRPVDDALVHGKARVARKRGVPADPVPKERARAVEIFQRLRDEAVDLGGLAFNVGVMLSW